MRTTLYILCCLLIITGCKKNDEYLPPNFNYPIPQVNITENVNVGAYFYNYTAADWSKGISDTPLLGNYNALNVATMDQERKWADSAGVDFFIFNWNGASAGDPILNSFAGERSSNVKMVINYNTAHINASNASPVTGAKLATLIREFKSLSASHFNKDYYYKIDGQPVVLITPLNLASSKAASIDYPAVMAALRCEPVQAHLRQVRAIFDHKRLQWLNEVVDLTHIPLSKLVQYDHQLRTGCRKEMKALTEIIYLFDVYIAVANVARTKQLCYARALPKLENVMRIAGLFHPSLEQAVPNHISFTAESNVAFLTGANMAGKSTFMKSFGIAVYLSHMGFPVAAGKMEFSVKDGLFSTINVPDSLEHGYSHFYAEVLRVKRVAEEVGASKDLVVIFDELFKGTNVKDAFDATLAITSAFSAHTNSFFIISSHIIEVGEALRERGGSYQFLYLPTIMEGNVPRYTYRLTTGITGDRHGMIIIENEGLIELIRKRE